MIIGGQLNINACLFTHTAFDLYSVDAAKMPHKAEINKLVMLWGRNGAHQCQFIEIITAHYFSALTLFRVIVQPKNVI